MSEYHLQYRAISTELVSKEGTYVIILGKLQTFMHLVKGRIPEEEFRRLFPRELTKLLAIHREVLSSLKATVEHYMDRYNGIGRCLRYDAIGKYKDAMRAAYKPFLQGYPAMCQIYAKHASSSVFQYIDRQCVEGVDGHSLGMNLLALLLTPAQQLIKYKLLLKELIIADTEDHDYFLEPVLIELEDLLADFGRCSPAKISAGDSSASALEVEGKAWGELFSCFWRIGPISMMERMIRQLLRAFYENFINFINKKQIKSYNRSKSRLSK